MAEAIRVLLVCDQTDCQTFFEILSSRGCMVDSADNYGQAMTMITTQIYNAMVIDTTMPDASGQKNPSSGIVFMRQLKEAEIKAGIVLLTDNSFTLPLLKEAEQLGYSAFLSKDQQDDGVMNPVNGPEILYQGVVKASRVIYLEL